MYDVRWWVPGFLTLTSSRKSRSQRFSPTPGRPTTTGMWSLDSSVSGPTPESRSSFGESRAPADKITSFLARTRKYQRQHENPLYLEHVSHCLPMFVVTPTALSWSNSIFSAITSVKMVRLDGTSERYEPEAVVRRPARALTWQTATPRGSPELLSRFFG